MVQAFREVMAHVCTPVAVITAIDGDRAHGTTVSAFSSLSMNPPMMMVSLDRASDLLAIIRRTGGFGVNVLAHHQDAEALRFARKGDDEFEGIEWTTTSGVPRLTESSGWVACRAASFVDGGDHVVVFGDIVDADHATAEPLTYHARAFGTHVAADIAP
ncbi:flavin reductase family protein [Gordonia humi]|nr:flavin reductase family protein [Gordonia humi]